MILASSAFLTMRHFVGVSLALLLLAASLPAYAAVTHISRIAAPSYAGALEGLANGQTSTAQGVLSHGTDPVLNKVLQGLLMAQPGNDYSFDALAGFVSENPDWPGLNGIMMIAEQKIPDSAQPSQVVNWFNAHTPLTLVGFYRYIDALDATGQSHLAANLIRSRWIEKDFTNGDMVAFRSRYAPVIRPADDAARLDRLLWDNNISAARAMYPYINDARQALADARIALENQTSNAESLLAKVPASLQRDPGLLYERLRWRRKNDDTPGALEILADPPADLVHPDTWWQERHILVRRMIEQKEFANAYKLAARHGLTTGINYVQAESLCGWLALRFLRDPQQAEIHFRAILEDASSPISRARGYYWLGRALEAMNKKNEARQAYESAAVLNTTYYGQLATTRIEARPTIVAATEPSIPPSIRNSFFARDAVRATEKLYKMNQTDLAKRFFKSLTDDATQRVQFALLLELAYQLQRPDWAVNIAKAANQKNFVMRGGAYPVLAMQIPTPPDIAFTHALIRQESMFRADVGSPAGARGLMQLMPGTAKDTAKKLGLPFSPERLTDPDYNVRLGTTFIQHQIDNFDGSIVLALAGYNAGPRRVREWIDTYGDPRTSSVDPIDWIELIPIYETRNYVQRIIENLQFYRARLNNGKAPLLILEDLKR